MLPKCSMENILKMGSFCSQTLIYIAFKSPNVNAYQGRGTQTDQGGDFFHYLRDNMKR